MHKREWTVIVHLAFFKWKTGLSEDTLDTLREKFAALQETIPEIRSFRWITNSSTEGLDRGFLEGICVELDSVQARQRYLEHPAHRAFAAGTVLPALEDGLESVMVFDYEGHLG